MNEYQGSDNESLYGRTAIVTGASRGIGRAVALMLARSGANVAIMSRNQDALSQVHAQVKRHGVQCYASAFDASDCEQLARFIEEANENLGQTSILVNNAGAYLTEPVETQVLSDWHKILETNLTSAMWACKCVLSGMINLGWGRIVNISSISGKTGEAFGAAYSASKFGMLGLTQSLALEVARHGVTVNAVCPGWVQTDMAVEQLTDERWCELNEIPPGESIDIAKLSVPQGRFIEPDEVAGLVRYLCTHQARGITGQAINICGGLSIH